MWFSFFQDILGIPVKFSFHWLYVHSFIWGFVAIYECFKKCFSSWNTHLEKSRGLSKESALYQAKRGWLKHYFRVPALKFHPCPPPSGTGTLQKSPSRKSFPDHANKNVKSSHPSTPWPPYLSPLPFFTTRTTYYIRAYVYQFNLV